MNLVSPMKAIVAERPPATGAVAGPASWPLTVPVVWMIVNESPMFDVGHGAAEGRAAQVDVARQLQEVVGRAGRAVEVHGDDVGVVEHRA